MSHILNLIDETTSHNDKVKIENNPWRPTLYYFLFGLLWLLSSNRIFSSQELYTDLEAIKGVLFILLTSVGIYFAFKLHYNEVFDLNNTLQNKNEELVAHSEEMLIMEKELLDSCNSMNELTSSLLNQKQLVEEIYNNSNTAIMLWEMDGTIIDFNNHFADLLGYDDEILGENWVEILVPKNEYLRVKKLINLLLKNHKVSNYESEILTKDGQSKFMLWNDSIIMDPVRNHLIVASFGLDITSEKEKEKTIEALSKIDALTSLGNRSSYDMAIESLIELNEPFSIYLMGIDNFKALNEIYGPSFGDTYLQQISKEFSKMKNITAYRWSGDEIIFLEKSINPYEVNESIAQINLILNNKRRIKNINVNTNCSIGSATYPKHGKSKETLNQNLEIALNLAKNKGKNNHQVFHNSFKDKITENKMIEDGIDNAISNNDFQLYMQPIFNIENGKYSKMETLLRWANNPVKTAHIGHVIEIAERSGQIINLDKWVLRNAFELIHTNRDTIRDIVMTINLSSQSFHSMGLLDYLKSLVNEFDITPQMVELEITEYTLIKNFERSRTIMTSLKEVGFRIALDDFGTEYSSLNYLSKLPFDTMKIDKSYIDGLINNKTNQVIIQFIIQMATELGLDTVAEGIETEHQRIMLKNIGCHLGQGYLVSKPLNEFDALKLIQYEMTH